METYLTPEQLAKMIGLSVKTLNKWRWEGKGPHFLKLGRRVVYRLSDIDIYLQAQMRRSTSDTGEVMPCV